MCISHILSLEIISCILSILKKVFEVSTLSQIVLLGVVTVWEQMLYILKSINEFVPVFY